MLDQTRNEDINQPEGISECVAGNKTKTWGGAERGGGGMIFYLVKRFNLIAKRLTSVAQGL